VQTKLPAHLAAALDLCNTTWRAKPPGTPNNQGMKQYQGFFWGIGSRLTTFFNTVIPPNSKQNPWNSCHLGGGIGAAGDSATCSNATSFHPGGCNYTFADGSVKFLKETIDMKTYWALGTKAGGEILSSDSY